MSSKIMTWDEIKASTKDTLCCAEICKVVGVDPANLRDLARENPGSLGFPVICVGRAVRIPRLAFIRFMEGAGAHERSGSGCGL